MVKAGVVKAASQIHSAGPPPAGPVVLTGAAGRAGHAALKHLLEHGHEVIAVDTQPISRPDGEFSGSLKAALRADLTDLGQTLEVMQGAGSVIHLANIPAPGLEAPHHTFVQNVTMNHSVFTAATLLGLGRVVWASSETTLGLPFDVPPDYAPVDEAHYPHPESSYALSKVVSETMAQDFARHSGIPFVALRFSNILGPGEYRRFPELAWPNPHARKWNLWGYIDERDAALACRLALGAPLTGASSFYHRCRRQRDAGAFAHADGAGLSGGGAGRHAGRLPDPAQH